MRRLKDNDNDKIYDSGNNRMWIGWRFGVWGDYVLRTMMMINQIS